MIFSTSGRKPRSSISSASSRTSALTWHRSSFSGRPGRAGGQACRRRRRPLLERLDLRLVRAAAVDGEDAHVADLPARSSRSLVTWRHSSRVGVTTSACGLARRRPAWLESRSRGDGDALEQREAEAEGLAGAGLAWPMTSVPVSATGRVISWIGKGLMMPTASRASAVVGKDSEVPESRSGRVASSVRRVSRRDRGRRRSAGRFSASGRGPRRGTAPTPSAVLEGPPIRPDAVHSSVDSTGRRRFPAHRSRRPPGRQASRQCRRDQQRLHLSSRCRAATRFSRGRNHDVAVWDPDCAPPPPTRHAPTEIVRPGLERQPPPTRSTGPRSSTCWGRLRTASWRPSSGSPRTPKLAPTLADKAALAEMASAEFHHFEQLRDRLAEIGVEPTRRWSRSRRALDAFHEPDGAIGLAGGPGQGVRR